MVCAGLHHDGSPIPEHNVKCTYEHYMTVLQYCIALTFVVWIVVRSLLHTLLSLEAGQRDQSVHTLGGHNSVQTLLVPAEGERERGWGVIGHRRLCK